MPKDWSWFRPAAVGEVVELLQAHGEQAVLVAGGTALCLSPPRREGLAIIDLQQARLDRIEQADGCWRLGAMVTARHICRHPDLAGLWSGMLPGTARVIGSQPVRNRVTLGGNVMQIFRWSDLPVALLALDAQLVLAGPGGSRRLRADEMFQKQPRRSLRPGELLSAVEVPSSGPHQSGAFVKFALSRVDHAWASVAVALTLSPDPARAHCQDVRVAVGALAPLPQRLEAAENALRGRELDAAALAEAREASLQCRIVADHRADGDYQRDLVRVLVLRALKQAWRAQRPHDQEAADVG